MKKTNKKMAIIALALVACLMVATISAYFTDADQAVNTFTVGKVSIDLQEENWNPPTDITPNKTFTKDPKVVNDGVNDAFVFMEVVVPYANVVVADVATGEKAAAADTELFTYEVKDGWVEIDTVTDEDAKTVTHVYAYVKDNALAAVEAGAETSTIFVDDEITFVNLVEDQGIEKSTLDVVVNAYAIQTENLTDDDTTDPEAVWAIVTEQDPTTDKATEETYTDILETEAASEEAVDPAA